MFPTSFAGANRSRFEGLRLCDAAALSARGALPCRDGYVLFSCDEVTLPLGAWQSHSQVGRVVLETTLE